MNKTWRNIGLIALAAGVLYYPALRMYRMASDKKAGDLPGDDMNLQKASYPVKKKNSNNENNNNNNNNHIGKA